MAKIIPNTKAKIQRKGIKKKEFSASFDAHGEFNIIGRAAFTQLAKQIEVHQPKALKTAVGSAMQVEPALPTQPAEDRRHILHYDEVLKPNIARVMAKLYKANNGNVGKVAAQVRVALAAKGLKKLPTEPGKVLERLVIEMNSATDNLVAGQADTNKAIEVVRGYVRKATTAISTFEFQEDALDNNFTRMGHYRQIVNDTLVTGGSGSDISKERDRIHGTIKEMVNGAEAPGQLWGVLHEVVKSVTFDLSEKASREATAKALEWEKQMSLNMEVEPEKQLSDLVSLI